MSADNPPPKIPTAAVHYGKHDPRKRGGGVEAFARNLGLIFEEMVFMTPEDRDIGWAVREGLPVVCDNHFVSDWPEDYPVIGFQHGVAARKAEITGSRNDRKLALLQARAAKRKAVVWVACARWIAREFDRIHGNGARRVVYHIVDGERFDGRRELPANGRSRLVLHDGRLPHKGKKQLAILAKELPGWHVEPLACQPHEVPDRMRGAAAFLHLSKYEGNSIVCNEAMAMDLPCLFTRVGLMLDDEHDFDVAIADVDSIYGPRKELLAVVGEFLDSLAEVERHPRQWVLENASLEAANRSWRRVMADLEDMRRDLP